jgi:hypothetical protein
MILQLKQDQSKNKPPSKERDQIEQFKLFLVKLDEFVKAAKTQLELFTSDSFYFLKEHIQNDSWEEQIAYETVEITQNHRGDLSVFVEKRLVNGHVTTNQDRQVALRDNCNQVVKKQLLAPSLPSIKVGGVEGERGGDGQPEEQPEHIERKIEGDRTQVQPHVVCLIPQVFYLVKLIFFLNLIGFLVEFKD